MLIKKLLLTLPAAILPFTITTSCEDRNNIHTSSTPLRQTMATAQSADEWIQRLKTDLAEPYVYNETLSNLYAELPPQDQWPSLIKQLNELTATDKSFQKLTKKNHYQRGSSHQRKKLKLFASLLRGSSQEQEQLFKDLLINSDISNYRAAETILYLAAFTNDTEEATGWLKKHHPSIFKKEPSSRSSYRSDTHAWDKPLAEGNIEKGLKLLKAAAHANPTADETRISELTQLLKIAIVLNKEDLAKDTADRIEKRTLQMANSTSQYSSYFNTSTFTNYLANTKQWQRSLNFSQNLIKAIEKKNRGNGITNNYSQRNLITAELTAIYHIKSAQAFSDKLEAAKTNNSDYADLLDSSSGNQPEIGNLYIDHLIAKNDKPNALNILKNLLARNLGTDSYYAKLLKTDPKNAAALIQKFHTYDPYEERPLIWLAEIALKNNQIEKAEKLIKQAIDLDPSDGDHGKDSRMLCYDVLARILQKQGNQEKADFFFQVVQSIRDGEAADDFRYAGLISEATRRYKAALGKFNDAYCLQSRLALTLAEEGKFEEAIPHFEKAFNLMPVSFGPRESHCFGCEGLFDDERVQKLALPILEAFAAKNPENPRTPYLLGLVFNEMNKPDEAATAFKKALQLDPQYFNSASKLFDIVSKDDNQADELKALSAVLFKLAPYISKPNYINNTQDLKTYWETADNFPPPPFELTPLTPKPKPSQKQYINSNNSYTTSHGYFDSDNAVDGWSKDELCLNNKFLEYIQQLQAKN